VPIRFCHFSSFTIPQNTQDLGSQSPSARPSSPIHVCFNHSESLFLPARPPSLPVLLLLGLRSRSVRGNHHCVISLVRFKRQLFQGFELLFLKLLHLSGRDKDVSEGGGRGRNLS
jgi:hypothetical protein